MYKSECLQSEGIERRTTCLQLYGLSRGSIHTHIRSYVQLEPDAFPNKLSAAKMNLHANVLPCFHLQGGAGKLHSITLTSWLSHTGLHCMCHQAYAMYITSSAAIMSCGNMTSCMQVPAPWTAELCEAVGKAVKSLSSLQNLLPNNDFSFIGEVRHVITTSHPGWKAGS